MCFRRALTGLPVLALVASDRHQLWQRMKYKGRSPELRPSSASTLPASIAENLIYYALPCSLDAGFHLHLRVMRTLHALPSLIWCAETGAWIARESLAI